MSLKRLILGKRGENIAEELLLQKKYTIIERNFRTRCGEIDIIAKDNRTIVFVEVKTRSSTSHGSPLHGITKRKQIQISKVALEYLSMNNLFDNEARFDVISVLHEKNGKTDSEHILNAFELSYGFS